VTPPILRDYRDSDLEAVFALWRRAWDATFPEIDFSARLPWFRERWARELLPTNKIRIAERAGEIVGFVTVEPSSGYLDQLAVAPEFWGKDVADILIAEAKRMAPAGIVLHVNTEHARAVRFYERAGFVRAGEEIERNPFSNLPIWRYVWKP
jgi:putative acetyltransferase